LIAVTIAQPAATVPDAPFPVHVDASEDTGVGLHHCVVEVDGTKYGLTLTGPGPYETTVDATSWADGSVHKLAATAFDNSVPRLSQRAVEYVTVSAAPKAAFTATQDKATRVLLDGGGSIGHGLTYSWTLDGTQVATGLQASIVPRIGEHTVTLTVTDDQGRSDPATQTVNVIWRGWPYTAQVDKYGPNPGSVDTIGPWRVLDAIVAPDHAEYHPNPDGSLRFEVHQGDHPSTSGGDRAGIGLNEAYDWQAAGAAGPLDLQGNTDHRPRFYRVEFSLPSLNVFPLVGYNNFVEWRGGEWTSVKIANIRVVFTPKALGVAAPPVVIDDHAMTPDRWENYVLEILLSPDPAVGYVRVWRDGICRSCGMAQADAEGRIFGATQKTAADGVPTVTTLEQQLYRHPDVVPVGYMDVRNTEIGASYDAVT
jgi:hypothetical protein